MNIYQRKLSRRRAEIFFAVYVVGGCPFMSATFRHLERRTVIILFFFIIGVHITIYIFYNNCFDICFIIDQITSGNFTFHGKKYMFTDLCTMMSNMIFCWGDFYLLMDLFNLQFKSESKKQLLLFDLFLMMCF